LEGDPVGTFEGDIEGSLLGAREGDLLGMSVTGDLLGDLEGGSGAAHSTDNLNVPSAELKPLSNQIKEAKC